MTMETAGQQEQTAKLKDKLERLKSLPQHTPPNAVRQFTPSVKEIGSIDAPEGIIGHLMQACGGNADGSRAVEITSSSFKREARGVNIHSGADDDHPSCEECCLFGN
jgi:hypothetical protein